MAMHSEDATMSTQTAPQEPPLGDPPDWLQNGDRLTQKEFHALYERMPEGFRAELIEGIVYVSSPVKRRHSSNHSPLGAVLLAYENATPGAESYDNATVILGDGVEVQPDLLLRVAEEYGGSSTVDQDDYISGPPELVCEISDSTRSLDLNAKKAAYRRAGVPEYLVLNLRDRRLHWFDLAADAELTPDADNVYRLRVFPGLWIDAEALFARDLGRLLATLNVGLASPEHAAFVAKLAAAKSA